MGVSLKMVRDAKPTELDDSAFELPEYQHRGHLRTIRTEAPDSAYVFDTTTQWGTDSPQKLVFGVPETSCVSIGLADTECLSMMTNSRRSSCEMPPSETGSLACREYRLEQASRR